MVSSTATTVEEYLASLPAERRAAIAALRDVVVRNLPVGYAEGMLWGMICYYVPLERYPATYNKQPLGYVALASQKNHLAIYLMGAYSSPETREWFESEYRKTGKKLNMGRSCLRFTRLDDLPLDLIGRVVARTPVDQYLQDYERARGL